MYEPFLFKFKQPCTTINSMEPKFYYDNKTDMVVTNLDNKITPAICCKGSNIPGTKKADLEKGEDSKDTLMWH